MRKPLVLAMAVLLMGACVTVNVYFPAAAAQKAADAIIDDIQGGAPDQKPAPTPKPGSGLYDGLKRLSFGASVALAAEDLQISTPAIQAIRESLKARYAQLNPHFDSGVLGLTNNGLIAIRDASGLNLKDKATLAGLVDQQNRDLKALYEEITKANKLGSDSVPRLQKTFADRFRERAKPGRWIQTDAGAWVQK
jgi:uncharacterized protein